MSEEEVSYRTPRVRPRDADTAYPLIRNGGEVDRRLLGRLLTADLPAGAPVTYGELTLFPSERTPTVLVCTAPATDAERVVNPAAHRSGEELLSTLNRVVEELGE